MMFLSPQKELISYVNNIEEVAKYFERLYTPGYYSIKAYPPQNEEDEGLYPVFAIFNSAVFYPDGLSESTGGIDPMWFGYLNKLPNPWIYYNPKNFLENYLDS